MRRLALTIAIACVLSGVARAGEIHSTGIVAPPAPAPSSVTTTGEIPSTGATGTQSSGTVLAIILTIIGSFAKDFIQFAALTNCLWAGRLTCTDHAASVDTNGLELGPPPLPGDIQLTDIRDKKTRARVSNGAKVAHYSTDQFKTSENYRKRAFSSFDPSIPKSVGVPAIG